MQTSEQAKLDERCKSKDMPLKEWEALSISVPISWNVTSSGNNSENGSSLANRHQGNNKIDLE